MTRESSAAPERRLFTGAVPVDLPAVFQGFAPGAVSVWDVIPDTHGQAGKLEGLLAALGYAETVRRGGVGVAYKHPDSGRKAIFLGDFIDRGPSQARVLEIARRMVGEGQALAILGNHELNGLLYATRHPETGAPLRPHNPQNTKQHRAFLEAFPLGSRKARDMLDWIQSLPLFLDMGEFRIAHACWADAAIAEVRTVAPMGVLEGELLHMAADQATAFGQAVDAIAKGPEADMPEGYSFVDRTGVRRTRTRVAWWNPNARTWIEIAASMPDPERCLPKGPASEAALGLSYPETAPPVFVGHYWLRGEVAPQAHNVFCLDYSAGADGPLLGYAHPAGATGFDLRRLTRFDDPS